MSTLRLDIQKRLLYAKYLLERARRAQQERAELGFAVSLLLMHDATEMVMLAVLDFLNVKPKKQEFMEFWKAVEDYDKENDTKRKAPPSRTAMEGMNKARVALKHYGLLPSVDTVREFLPRVQTFCERISDTYLGVELSDLTLADLIDSERARNLLKKSEEQFAAGNKQDAVIFLRMAFDELERELDPELRPINPNCVLYCEESEALRRIANDVNVLTLGIDPLRYRFFHRNTPIVEYKDNGNRRVVDQRTFADMSESVFRACFDFVVEFALRIAELFHESTLGVECGRA